MTKKDLLEVLKGWGVRKTFKPVLAEFDDVETWLLRTNREPGIVDGALVGTEIRVDLGRKCFRVWTGHKQKAKAIAAEFGLKVWLGENEAELYVTREFADEVLPRFGAKVKRGLSAKQQSALATGRRNSPIYKTVQG